MAAAILLFSAGMSVLPVIHDFDLMPLNGIQVLTVRFVQPFAFAAFALRFPHLCNAGYRVAGFVPDFLDLWHFVSSSYLMYVPLARRSNSSSGSVYASVSLKVCADARALAAMRACSSTAPCFRISVPLVFNDA